LGVAASGFGSSDGFVSVGAGEGSGFATASLGYGLPASGGGIVMTTGGKSSFDPLAALLSGSLFFADSFRGIRRLIPPLVLAD